jgi:dolichol-phosphate mannosyltransferase
VTSARRVLITGAGGFVGAYLARRLVELGHDVTAVLRPGGTRWRIEDIAGDLRIAELHLTDREAVGAAIRETRADWIFHFAAHGGYSWEEDFRRIVDSNLLATGYLLEAGAQSGFESFVHAGSSSEYGYKDHAPAETEAVDPNSVYAVTKAAATALCRQVAVERDLPVVTLRLYSVYGPWEDSRRLVPTLIVRGLRGELPPLVSPDTVRDFIYVEDVADAFIRCAVVGVRPGALYNLGSGRQVSIGELVELDRRLLSVSAEPSWGSAAPRRWDTATWVANTSAIERDLGWKPRVGIEEGFSRTIEWLRRERRIWSVYGIDGID